MTDPTPGPFRDEPVRQAQTGFAAAPGGGAFATSSRVPAFGRRTSGKARRGREFVILAFLVLCGVFTLITTASIVAILFGETYAFLTQFDQVSVGEFFFGLQWNPLLGNVKHFGIWPLITGTALITLISMMVSVPLGLVTAIYLSEYAPAALRSTLKPVLEVLAGVPTVVLGFFALTVLTPGLQWLYPGFGVYNATSAGIAVGILTLPIVTSLIEDALRAVPRSLREASNGLGATKFETSVKVVVPAALSGIIAAVLLAIARAVGETMIVALAAGAVPLPLADRGLAAINPAGPVQPMTGYMVQIFLGDASNFGIEYASSYAVAAMLFLMTLVLTLVGHLVRVRYTQVYE